jgi:hypothetical protein
MTFNPSFIMKKLSFIFIAFVFFACTYEQAEKPSATGKAGELLVVIDNNYFQDIAGTAIRDVFQAYIPMELSREPFYDVVQITPENFSRLYESHRHIFIADINPNYGEPTIEKSNNHWSRPQLVIRVKAPSQESFVDIMSRRGESLVKDYIKTEFERYIAAYRRMLNVEAIQVVEEKFGFTLAIPEGYFVAIQGDNFIWLRQTGSRTDMELGILIATSQYTDPSFDFAPETIKNRRDEITKQYIHGVTEGSYMTTYSKETHPEVQFNLKEIDFNGFYAVEARSLWKMEGEFSGGPFVNFTMVDPNTSRLVMLDGWVFYPNKDKRDFMRQVEALIRSIEFKPPA